MAHDRMIPVQTAEAVLDPYIRVIHALARGDCWCEVAINNPMFTRHTDACKQAQALLGKPKVRP